MEDILMSFIGLLVIAFLAVIGAKHFLHKKFKSDKFILEEILKWEEFLNLFKDSNFRKRLLVTLVLLITILLGNYILIPGVNIMMPYTNGNFAL